jgi:hypothetical protein
MRGKMIPESSYEHERSQRNGRFSKADDSSAQHLILVQMTRGSYLSCHIYAHGGFASLVPTITLTYIIHAYSRFRLRLRFRLRKTQIGVLLDYDVYNGY